ncbi:MAG: hypothetical protein RL707_1834, partial [Pseudomonadota bacterium]
FKNLTSLLEATIYAANGPLTQVDLPCKFHSPLEIAVV